MAASDEPNAPVVFDEKRAASYNAQWAKIAPMRAALDLLIRVLFSELPADARVLCVGVGTGTELLDLAQANPGWRFTAVEPAAPMLAVCRRRVEAAGFTDRCAFHEGYLDSLPETTPFDAATCLVVSHFLTDTNARRDLFKQIAMRLKPGGLLVSSDLSGDAASAEYESLASVWWRMMRWAGLPGEEIEKMQASWGRDVALLPPNDVAAIIASGGFDAPTLFFQSLLLRAWFARRR